MTRHTVDSNDATCRVLTAKEGLLSAMAHDLEIDVRRFSISWDEAQVEASFEAGSLVVLHPMSGGRPNPSALSDRDQRKIEETIRADVLKTKQHPNIRFECSSIEGEGDARVLHGRLTLLGRERPLAVRVRRAGPKWIAEATIHQPDFGITPYTAMLGALRISADVRIRIEVPA